MLGEVSKAVEAGKIDKSHPIHPRNEDKKSKTKLAAVVVEPPRQAKAAAAQNGKVAKGKEDAKAEVGKDSKSTAAAKSPPSAAKASSSGGTPVSPAASKVAAKKDAAPAPLPPRPEVVAKQKLAEQVALARRELGLPTASASGLSSNGSKGDLQLLASGSAAPAKAGSAAPPSAWGKPTPAVVEPLALGLQPPMMSQLPQLQQLYQAASKKPAAKVATAAPAALAAPTPKPAPAVPQPVLNPPTPVWPALGSTQSSAAAMLAGSGSSVASGQTPREGQARPASPPSAWGPSVAGSGAIPAASAQQPVQHPSSAAPASASRALPHVGSGGGLTSSAAAGALEAAPVVAASTPMPAVAAGASPADSGAVSQEEASEVPASLETSTSGRCAAAEAQQTGTAAPLVAGSAPAGRSGGSGAQLAGSDGGEEEVKEQKLTKAQKKNLKRLERKKGPQASSSQLQLAAESAAAGEAQPGSGAAAGSSQPADDAGAAAAAEPACGTASGAHKRHGSCGSDAPERAQPHFADAESGALSLEERCVCGIVAQQMQLLMAKLQRLGAPEYLAAAAVQRHGSNLLGALEWLLVAGPDAANAPPGVVLAAAAESPSAADAEVDISGELQRVRELQAALGAPAELLYQAVVDCNGDVAAAAKAAMASLGTSTSFTLPRAGSGRRPSDGEPSTSGQGTGAALPSSASYYSVSSLDTATGTPDQPQPSYSNHFGVRLVEDAAQAAGSGACDSGGESYAAGLLRGGVALGASGWPNGSYVRDSPPAGAGANGRSTSRLLHWLRDGRTVAMEEEGASCNGGPVGSDHAMESPFSAHGDAARRQAASASPSLNNWLGSNGFHPPAPYAPLAAATGGRTDSQELFSTANSGAFSFSSALSKPSMADYGSRWGGPAANRQDAAGVGATEAESAPHNDGDSDLSSIMALINTR
ncbi:hypothetical protein GPECTOR_1g588 [Gonium pectorale]|uniref:UBA domain-containing protein n=1 Tax=Gonium pectorale TaxID=33097 RepID=A0A150H3Q6_GONPE|nr:hypothetical protein GPECTOR_1g588 [Gonium pectorale]|eukprot:KXZ56652.1 hypothetical protein GPECTOR_1g588 [Gonium pectorale]